DVFKLGKVELTALATPGHTPDSICVHARAGDASVVFTGDTLFIGSSGRTDFPGADPAQQWASIHETLGALPGHTLIYPGHDYSDLLSSTMDTERKKTPHWLKSREEFIAFKKSELIPAANDEIRKRVDYNRAANPAALSTSGGACTACGAPSNEPDRTASINV